jgi:hypothetical protein
VAAAAELHVPDTRGLFVGHCAQVPAARLCNVVCCGEK